jgi:amino acid transporter
VINCGGTQDTGYIGGRYWADPGAFHNGVPGFCSVLVVAAFSFSGTELVGLAAAETQNPSRSLPTAIKQVFWRIAIVSTVHQDYGIQPSVCPMSNKNLVLRNLHLRSRPSRTLRQPFLNRHLQC